VKAGENKSLRRKSMDFFVAKLCKTSGEMVLRCANLPEI